MVTSTLDTGTKVSIRMQPTWAALVSAALSAPIEYAGNIFQLKLLASAAKKMGLTKIASGKMAEFLSKNGKNVKGIIAKNVGKLGLGAEAEGLEEVGQSYTEAFGDVMWLSCRTIQRSGLMLGRR
jgi:hypothetical protein